MPKLLVSNWYGRGIMRDLGFDPDVMFKRLEVAGREIAVDEYTIPTTDIATVRELLKEAGITHYPENPTYKT